MKYPQKDVKKLLENKEWKMKGRGEKLSNKRSKNKRNITEYTENFRQHKWHQDKTGFLGSLWVTVSTKY